MRLSPVTLTLLLSPLSALATPNLASESTSSIVKRTPMKPLMARQSPSQFLARSPSPDDDDVVCASDEKRCGNACVQEDYTCCPDNVSGGCPSNEECQEDDDRWGCCPDGDDCSWDDNDDDDDNFLDDVGDTFSDIGNDIEDGFNDIFNDDDDDAAGMLKPGVMVAVLAAVGAAVLPL
ncbi:hypothetical protein BJY04DRAFT_216224 [Aspergillus karnatakaensis]|uniref:uncharacterized protein n=1 Tax=Aspergillus karnatakaensis TaxID=1810916 RepID=UPI003CCCE64D